MVRIRVRRRTPPVVRAVQRARPRRPRRPRCPPGSCTRTLDGRGLCRVCAVTVTVQSESSPQPAPRPCQCGSCRRIVPSLCGQRSVKGDSVTRSVHPAVAQARAQPSDIRVSCAGAGGHDDQGHDLGQGGGRRQPAVSGGGDEDQACEVDAESGGGFDAEGRHAHHGAPQPLLRCGAEQCEDEARRGGDGVGGAGLQSLLRKERGEGGVEGEQRMFAAPSLHPVDLATQAQHFSRAGVRPPERARRLHRARSPASFLEDIF